MDKNKIIQKLNIMCNEVERLRNWQSDLLQDLLAIRAAVENLPEPTTDSTFPYTKAKFLLIERYHPDVKINMIKVVHEITGLGLKEAKDMVEEPMPLIIQLNPFNSTIEARRSAHNSLLIADSKVKFCWR